MVTLTYIFKISWYEIFVADHIAIIYIKLWCRIYSTFFCVFQVTHFQSGKWRLSCVETSSHADICFLKNSRTVIIIRKQLSNWSNSFRENWLYVFSKSPRKGGKGSNIFGVKIKMFCSPPTGLRIRWNFATASSRLLNPLTQPFKKEDEEKKKNGVSAGKTEWLIFASKTSYKNREKRHINYLSLSEQVLLSS